MDMAATGIPSARGLAQPPERPDPAPCRRGLRFPIWAAAVLMISAFGLIVAGAVASGANAAATSTTVPGDGAVIVPILFPLENRVTWTDTFGAPRSGGRTHAGNDLMVPKMTPLLAVVDGTVDWLNLTGKLSSYNSLPYYNILLHGDDGNDYFYIHLNNDTPGTDDGKGGVEYAYAPGLTNGSRVNMGDVIGYAGDSGNAEDAGSQLHFEIHLGGYVAASAGETRTPSAIDPYNSLKAAPTLAEWEAAGRPPIATMVTQPGSDASTSTSVTTTTSSPASSTPTTTVRPSGRGHHDHSHHHTPRVGGARVYRRAHRRLVLRRLCSGGGGGGRGWFCRPEIQTLFQGFAGSVCRLSRKGNGSGGAGRSYE
jgi:murein DD-endopeptidase MepM/ murein hydrolase activator NlpD